MKPGTLAEHEGKSIRIDMQALPAPVLEHLAAVTCEGVLDYFRQPGVPEAYEKWLQKRNSRKDSV